MSNGFDDLCKMNVDLQNRVKSLEIKSTNCEKNCSKITELENKIDTMEQKARQCNAEINNLPERRGENVIALILNMGVAVKQPITQQDIVAAHRVPHASSNVSRPKNIVVQFTNKIIRDNFIAAVRIAKGVTSDQLNISGTPQRLYVNEHLTLKNKKLFREARVTAKENEFRYVWIKHGTVLARANDTSAVFAIKSCDDLQKIIKSAK